MGFQIPQLPTDSMYKFIAFAGLICILVSFYGFYSYYKDTKRRMEKLGEDATEIYKAFKTAQREFDIRRDDANSLTPVEEKIASKALEDLRNEHKDIRKKAETLRDDPKTSIELKILVVILCVGTAVFLSGLSTWYFKRQRYEDMIIQGEAEKYFPRNTR